MVGRQPDCEAHPLPVIQQPGRVCERGEHEFVIGKEERLTYSGVTIVNDSAQIGRGDPVARMTDRIVDGHPRE